MIQVMIAAAAVDEIAAGILERTDRTYREALAQTARRMRDLHALRPGVTLERATDILWFYFGHRAWTCTPRSREGALPRLIVALVGDHCPPPRESRL